MIYVLFTILAVMFFKHVKYLKGVIKHDFVLYEFCQLRRDVIAHLHDTELNKKDTSALLSVLDQASNSIHHYNQLKVTYFNLRILRKEMKTLKKNINVDEEKVFSENSEIRKFEETLYKTYFYAFIAYSPLVSMVAGLLFFLMTHFVKLLVKLSARAFKRYINAVTKHMVKLQWFIDVKQERAAEQACN